MLLMPGATSRAVRETVSQRGLPPEIAELIARVVRRTHLRHAEQVDIAAELSSHFAEGLARGTDAAALVRDFGEVHAAARRLRHGAISKRSPADRAIRLALRGVGAFLVVLVVRVRAFGHLALHPYPHHLLRRNRRRPGQDASPGTGGLRGGHVPARTCRPRWIGVADQG